MSRLRERLARLASSSGGQFAAYSFCSNILNGMSGVAVIRFLEPVALGWWNSSQLLRLPFDFLRLGIISGMSREYPHLIGGGKTDEATGVLETAFAYTLGTIVVSQLMLAGLLIYVGPQHPMLLLGLATTGVAWAITAFSQHIQAMLRTSDQFLVIGKVGLLVALIDTASVLLVWRFGYLGLLVRALLSVGLTAVLFRRFQPVRVKPRLDWLLLKRLFLFGRHTFVTGFVLLLGANADRALLLTQSDGVRLLGLYTPALIVSSVLQIVPGNLQSFHYPRIIEGFGRNGDRSVLTRATLRLVGRTAMAMTAMSLVVAVAVVFLVRFFLPAYAEGLTAAIIVCATGPFLACKMATTYFAALHRWPEYYVYTALQCALPFLAIHLALRFLPPLTAAALGSVVAVAASGAALVSLVMVHSTRAGQA